MIAFLSADEGVSVRVVTVYELFQDNGEHQVAPDGVHPGNDGYRELSEALMASIEGRDVAFPAYPAQSRALRRQKTARSLAGVLRRGRPALAVLAAVVQQNHLSV